MGPKKNKGKGGGGGDKQNQPPPPQQQAQQQTEASQPPQRQQQAARGGQQQGRPQQQERHQPQAERKPQGQESQQAPQQQPQAWRQPPLQQQQQPQPQSQTQQGQGRQQQAGGRPQQVQGSQQPLQQAPQQQPPAWRQPPLQQQQQPQSQAQQGPGPQQQAWGRPQQGQGPQQPLQQAPRGRGRGRGEAQQRPPGFEQQRAFPQGPSQGPVQAAVSGVPPAQPPKSAWGKPQTAPVNIPSVANVEVKVQSVQLSQSESTVKKPDQQTGKGDKRGKGKDEQKSKPGGEKPHTAPEPGQASASGQQASAQDEAMLKENLAEFPPPRKPPGTLFSAKLRVKVNFFEISFDMRSPTKYQYDIKIEPPRPKGFFYMIVETFMANHFPGRFYAYDGNQILYTGHPLGDGLHQPMTAEITINDHDRQSERNYSVTIKFSADIDMSVLHEKMLQQKSLEDNRIVNARTCLQIIFRGNSARYNVIQRGRAFFHPTREINIGKGKVIKPGIGHTVVLGSKPFLNLDMIYQIFPKSGNVIDSIIHEVCGPAPRPNNPPQRINLSLGLKDWQKKDLEEFVKGLRVEVKLPEGPILRRSPVKGLADCSSRNWFEKEGKKITVQQHFLEFYRYRIQNSELPCVWFGSEDKKYCYPIELCVILPNQSKKFRNTDSDIRAIGNEATCTTQQREEKIKEAANVINIKPSNEYLADFGVEVSGEFKKVDSRILIHPKLGYRSSIVEVNKGQWEPGIFRGAKSLSRWCIVVFDDYVNSDHVEKFKRNFISWGKKLGMTIDDINPDRHVIYERADVRENDMKNLFKYCLEKYDDDIQLMLVVLPMRNTKEVRSRVKILCEIQSKVLTSCIKASTFQRADGSILKNLFLKINSKLAGVNHIVSPVPRPEGTNQGYIQGRTMVLGADVTHTAPQDRQKIPSVAAVVASYDEHASLYSMEWTFQNPSITEHEIIQDLKEMVINHLKFYKTKNDGVTPERLFFFRDGVSEGEFDKVRFKELRAIRDACQDICGKFIPLTFIIVQKRHRTRFIPDPENQDEKKTIYDRKNNNVPAGTVVDKVIVRQDMFEFYLVSHASLLGTARPTKYKTILDECNISADELEHLTYYLCHMFNRCSRSVSYPAPTYYAHLACKRIRDYLLTERVNMSNLKAEERRLKGDQEFYLNNPLYFI